MNQSLTFQRWEGLYEVSCAVQRYRTALTSTKTPTAKMQFQMVLWRAEHKTYMETIKMNSKVLLAAGVIAVVGIAGYTWINRMPMGGMDNSVMSSDAAASEPTKGFEGAMTTMMQGMMVAPTGKPDLDFMQGMMPHHQGAIDMANVVLKFGKDPEVKTLAENVIKAQETEIGLINAWLAKIDASALPASPEAAKENATAMQETMKAMVMTYTGDADTDFMKSMIPHHQGAIENAKTAVKYAKDAVVLKLANEIITAQESEITFMTDWLKRNGKQ